jgi:hypothetical protein
MSYLVITLVKDVLALLAQTHGAIPHGLETLQRVVRGGSGSHISILLNVIRVL